MRFNILYRFCIVCKLCVTKNIQRQFESASCIGFVQFLHCLYVAIYKKHRYTGSFIYLASCVQFVGTLFERTENIHFKFQALFSLHFVQVLQLQFVASDIFCMQLASYVGICDVYTFLVANQVDSNIPQGVSYEILIGTSLYTICVIFVQLHFVQFLQVRFFDGQAEEITEL